MNYSVGDKVVHWTHGLGTVVAIEQKEIAGISQQYYVIEINLLKLWVPIEVGNAGSIRPPAKRDQFQAVFAILRTPGQQLPDRQYERKLILRDRMQKKTLEGLCHIIRDLADWSKLHSLNYDDSLVRNSAQEHLLDEWVLSLNADRSTAQGELEVMLQGSLSNAIAL